MKAFQVGTAGVSDYTVVEKIYGMVADATNNHNKYYACELHQGQNGSSGKWYVYVDYGRVGKTAVKKEYLQESGTAPSEHEARDFFRKQVHSKFGKVVCSECGHKSDTPGTEKCSSCSRSLSYKDYPKNKYIPVHMAQANVGSEEAKAQIDTAKLSKKAQANVVVQATDGTQAKAPTYHSHVVDFINHIYEEAGHAARTSLNTGALKATSDNPLGTLSQSQLDIGKDVLADVTKMLNARSGKLVDTTDKTLMDLTSRWYGTIPQAIGMKPNWRSLCLNNWAKHQGASDLLDLLSDVKGVQTSFSASCSTHDRVKQMGVSMDVLDPADPEWKRIAKMSTTVSPSHRGRYGRCKVRRIFKVIINGQNDTWLDPDKVGNHQEMFHGSRNANMLGITSKGLLMRPPGVVITGSMFGNGLYFSPTSSPNNRDSRGCYASKSMQYASGGWGGTRNRRNNIYLFIVDVAQGRVKEYESAQSSLSRAPHGFDSVRGLTGRYLQHDEHIIYRLRQHRIKYIVDIDPGR